MFLCGAAFFLADMTSQLIAQRLEEGLTRPAVQPLRRPPVTERSVKDFSRILERNLFAQPAPLGGIVVPTPELLAPQILSPLAVRLVGTVVGDPEDSFAFIENTQSREQGLYRVNDLILGEAVLVRIARNQITLKRGGIEEILEVSLEETPAATPPSNRAAPLPQTSSVQEGGRYVIDKQEVQSALENLPQLLTKARIIPHLSPEGKSEGFRIVSIASQSLYEKIGLRNGDVIQRVNGVEVKDPESFLRVFSQLRDESNIALDLVRNNQPQTFSYEIR
jgi:general secretion pathway protein C